MILAPIALFVYNRPHHARMTLEALRANEWAGESDLFIFSDGPKNEGAVSGVAEVRDLIKDISGFRSVTVFEKEKNCGLGNSIIQGVGEMVSKFGKVIVLEDDLITSKYFLRYMNEALDVYENDERVISIHGYIYPIREKLPETFFIKGADCWGWATWKRGWDLFEADGKKLLDALREQKLEKEFDFNYSYPYVKMLKNQIAGRNNSWAIRWYASAFLRGKLTLYPGISLVSNVGFDNTGTHSGSADLFKTELATRPLAIVKNEAVEDAEVRKKFIRYFWRLKIMAVGYKIGHLFKRIFR